MITATKFRNSVGRKHKGNDLVRCNCTLAGEHMHRSCGWDDERGMPCFIPGESLAKKGKIEITHREHEVAMSHEAYVDLIKAWNLVKQLSPVIKPVTIQRLVDRARELPSVPGDEK